MHRQCGKAMAKAVISTSVHGHALSLTDAGAALGCSASTIRNHVARALKRLRTALEDTDG